MSQMEPSKRAGSTEHPYNQEMPNSVDPTARLGGGVQIGEFAVVEAGAILGDGVTLGHHVVIHADTIVGNGTWVGDGAVLGRTPRPAPTSTVQTPPELPPLEIGPGCIIGVGAVIYRGTTIGASSMVGDQAFVRDRCQIGHHVIIGSHTTLENEVRVGDYSKLQTGVYLCAWVTIEDHCFIAPCVVTTNDNYMGRTERRLAERGGCTIRRGARVGANVTLLPNVEVGREAFVAAGSIVTRDVPAATVVMGSPAKPVRAVAPEEFAET
jgi:acetyltransferase-like isoleucine patch superfamily enzyme